MAIDANKTCRKAAGPSLLNSELQLILEVRTEAPVH